MRDSLRGAFNRRDSPYGVHFNRRESPYGVHFNCRESPYGVHFNRRETPYGVHFDRRDSLCLTSPKKDLWIKWWTTKICQTILVQKYIRKNFGLTKELPKIIFCHQHFWQQYFCQQNFWLKNILNLGQEFFDLNFCGWLGFGGWVVVWTVIILSNPTRLKLGCVFDKNLGQKIVSNKKCFGLNNFFLTKWHLVPKYFFVKKYFLYPYMFTKLQFLVSGRFKMRP